MSRYFLALWPDDQTREKLAAVADRLAPDSGRRVRTQNLHITLAFLGHVAQEVVEELCAGCAQIKTRAFSLNLDHIGWWKRPRVLWLAADAIPDDLQDLSLQANALVQACGIKLDDRPYQPHLTLMRKVPERPRGVRFDPIYWNISDFCLVKSNTLPGGAEYCIVSTWPLQQPMQSS